MKKIMFGLLALLSGCTTESVSYEYKDEANSVVSSSAVRAVTSTPAAKAKKTDIGGNIDYLELIEYKDHEYLVYNNGRGVAMLHLESCKCKSVNK